MRDSGPRQHLGGWLRTLLVVLLAGLSAAGVWAQRLPAGLAAVTSVEGIDEYRLANGLQVLLVPDDSKPTTTVNLTYRVGSRHESYGETGMAHLLEHLLFKGSPKHPKAWAEFTKRGLAANGSTWFDRTNYTASFSTNEDNLNWYLGWLADSMVNSFIARRDLDTEMTVVRNEMESGENSPQRILFQRTLALMYDWHNYSKDTIGARADVENVDIARLQAFYRRYYQPDNATLIVAGKFDRAQVLRRVAASFGKLAEAQACAAGALHTGPGAGRGTQRDAAPRGRLAQVMASYHVPPGPHPDFAAVELLALVFGDVPSGRLHKRLTEKQLAAGTFGYAACAAPIRASILLGAQLAPGQAVDAARAELLATLESVAREPITPEELSAPAPNGSRVGRRRSPIPRRWACRCPSRWRRATGVCFSCLAIACATSAWRMCSVWPSSACCRDNRTLATYLPTEQPQRAPAPARVDLAAGDEGPQAAGGRGPGRGLRRHAGQHRGAHAAFRAAGCAPPSCPRAPAASR